MQEEQLQEVYDMVDNIPFSRPKKNINRDFSDAVMMAELLQHYQPKLVQLHNYPPTNSLTNKIDNWNTLNNKVLKKIGLNMNPHQIKAVAQATPAAIQELLYAVFLKFQRPEEEEKMRNRMKGGLGMSGGFSGGEQAEGRAGLEGKKRDETEELLSLVQQIDEATVRLQELSVINRQKDQIVKNLEEQVEKIIFS